MAQKRQRGGRRWWLQPKEREDSVGSGIPAAGRSFEQGRESSQGLAGSGSSRERIWLGGWMPHGPSGTTSWENCSGSHLIPPRGSGKQDPAGPHSLPQKLSLGAMAGSVGWVSVDFPILLAFLNTSALCSLLNCVMPSEPLLHFCLCLLSRWKPACRPLASRPVGSPHPHSGPVQPVLTQL